jgi:catechol 1,2-dioxygenase
MSAARKIEAGNPRLTAIFDDLVAAVHAVIRQHNVTHDEYRRAVAFMVETGEKGEMPLLLDVFLESTVDKVDSVGRAGTETCVEGPFYLPNAPALKSPCVVPHRPNEPGEALFFSGTIRSTDGAPLAGAVLDLWQSDAAGAYSHFNIPEAEAPFNLRARVSADQNGRFEVQTWVPAPYQIPKQGPTGALLAAMGRHAWRPAHLHARVSHDQCQTLTTQIFFTGDPWIDSDVVGAVKDSLVVSLQRHDRPEELRNRGVNQPFCTLSYDFVLPRTMAHAA